ncbi:MAG: BlaI/MecI/CopY family transcriptional regulator [Oscillospiraceae bacterium]|jgi:BlaI family penicillinase repressor|nr:BlaI/MecI/CopY family transcriptional regulator [Oscillospiraceae bacterium]
MQGKIALSNAEWKIMSLLWKRSPQTITEMVKTLNDEKEWTKHTLISQLKRMEVKGVVRYENNGRAKNYYPIIEQEEAIAQETKQFLDRVFDGSIEMMVTSLVKQQKLSEDKIIELYRILTDAEENTK